MFNAVHTYLDTCAQVTKKKRFFFFLWIYVTLFLCKTSKIKDCRKCCSVFLTRHTKFYKCIVTFGISIIHHIKFFLQISSENHSRIKRKFEQNLISFQLWSLIFQLLRDLRCITVVKANTNCNRRAWISSQVLELLISTQTNLFDFYPNIKP